MKLVIKIGDWGEGRSMKNLTKSKIFFYFCLSFVGGVAIASFFVIPDLVAGILLIGAILMIVLGWAIRWESVILGFCIILAVVGLWRFQAKSEVAEDDISRFNDAGKIVFVGVVDGEPDIRLDNTKLKVKVRDVEVFGGKISASGFVLATVNKYPEYQYGDQLEISGKLTKPEEFDGFDYAAYLVKDDIYSLAYWPEVNFLSKDQGNFIRSFLFKMKNSFKESLVNVLPEPQASLAGGLLLGERTTLPDDLKDVFNAVGITHIIALSGFNITIIADSLRRMFNYLMAPRQYSFWLAVFAIIGFVVMTGASPSIVRAAVMGILLILAQKTGRLYSIRNALIFAGMVMIFVNPKILRFDLAFQLSFLATLGLVYISPFVEKYLGWLPEKLDLRGIASATLGAQIAVLPLILYSFGRLSVVAPFANLLILPIIPHAMFWIFFGGLAGFFWLPAAKILGWISWLLLTYQIRVAELFAKIPFAAIDVNIGWGWMVVAYVLLWGGIARKLKNQDQKVRTVEI